MKSVRLFLMTLIIAAFTMNAQAQKVSKEYKKTANSIIQEALKDTATFERLTYLGDRFGHRFSGSQSLEDAIDWIIEEMKSDGLENVRGQDVMVPHWVRGDESATMISPRKQSLPMLGLGGSIGTPAEGITAEVLVVRDFEELQKRADEAKGKIVLFNLPFQGYGNTVQIRTQGAIEASKAGAVASLIRSVGDFSMKTAHTGMMRYADDVRKIPHAAITSEDAEMIHRISERGEKIEIHLYMEARTLPDAQSRNVIAEIRGTEEPEEVVVLGGHIDSWDVGTGMMDDGGGCVASWEALNIIKRLGLKPRRTIRVVLWTNEENGLRGGVTYKDSVAKTNNLENHILAMESDGGVFKPRGFGFGGNDEAYEIMKDISSLLKPIDADLMRRGGGGADISPLMRLGVPGMGHLVEGEKYFWYHHTDADTIDKLDRDEFNQCTAAMAVMAFVVADMEQDLPKDLKE